MVSIETLFGLHFLGDTLAISPTFAPESLETAKSIIIEGDCNIKGLLSCATIQGAEAGVPVVVVSTTITAHAVGDECWFVSPIFGMIYSMSMTALNDDLSGINDDFTDIYLYNGDGVRATTYLHTESESQYVPSVTTFDWGDPDDKVACAVGVGSSFCMRVEDIGDGTVDLMFTALITPMKQGGRYV